MSWSFSCIGKSAKVAEALEKHSATLTGQSKVEFDGALPHLVALVKENFVAPGANYVEPSIDFEASGSGSCQDPGSEYEVQLQRSCQVSIKLFWRTVVAVLCTLATAVSALANPCPYTICPDNQCTAACSGRGCPCAKECAYREQLAAIRQRLACWRLQPATTDPALVAALNQLVAQNAQMLGRQAATPVPDPATAAALATIAAQNAQLLQQRPSATADCCPQVMAALGAIATQNTQIIALLAAHGTAPPAVVVQPPAGTVPVQPAAPPQTIILQQPGQPLQQLAQPGLPLQQLAQPGTPLQILAQPGVPLQILAQPGQPLQVLPGTAPQTLPQPGTTPALPQPGTSPGLPQPGLPPVMPRAGVEETHSPGRPPTTFQRYSIKRTYQ